MNKEESLSATLFLKTSDISTAETAEADSAVGYWRTQRAQVTWRVNLRTLLGNEIYDKNNYFKLRLNNYSAVSKNSGGFVWSVASSDPLLTLYVSGLNFINNSYWQATQNNGVYGACLGQIPMPNGTSIFNVNITYTEDSAVVYFGKSLEEVELTFSWVRIVPVSGVMLAIPAGTVLPAALVPLSSICLRVSGVSKEEEKYLI